MESADPDLFILDVTCNASQDAQDEACFWFGRKSNQLGMTAFFGFGGRHFGPSEQRASPMESIVPDLFILDVTCNASQDAQDDKVCLVCEQGQPQVLRLCCAWLGMRHPLQFGEKDEGNRKDWLAFVVSHPSDKNNRVARVGHPDAVSGFSFAGGRWRRSRVV